MKDDRVMEHGKDGSPICKDADPDCSLCQGYGVLIDSEMSHYVDVHVFCPCTIKQETNKSVFFKE